MGEIKVKRHNSPLGASGTDVVGRIHNAEDHIEILQGFKAAEVYEKMRRSDTQVRKILNAIINPIKSATWAIEPASEDKKDLTAAALINQILFKDINWTKFMNECCTLIPHGFSVFEKVHKNMQNKEIGQYTGLAQLGFRRQNTITEWYHNRETGKLEKIKQESNSDIVVNVEIPVDFLLIFYSEQEGDNIGFPLLRNVYGPYKRKLLATELQYIGIERFAIPTPILKAPKNVKPSDQEYQDAVEVIRGFTSAEDAHIIYPDGWELTLHNNVFDPDKLNKVIKAENENMASAILASFLELGTGGNAGAFALSSDLTDFFFAGLSYYANIIKDTINHQLIPELIKFNYGDSLDVMPELTYSGLNDNAGKELMEVITGLVRDGVIIPDETLEDYTRKTFKLPKKAEGDAITNQETKGEGNGNPDDNPPRNGQRSGDDIDTDADDDSNNSPDDKRQLSELGHRHNGTGPSIKKGQKHYHELLDSNGNVTGRTSAEKDGADHIHVIDSNNNTGKPIQIKELKEPKENPKVLIEKHEYIIAEIVRRNLKMISEKYINDVLRKYESLGEKDKLRAIDGVKVGGTSKFSKELRVAMLQAARDSYNLVQKDVPGFSDLKLSENPDKLREEFEIDSFKFNEFSKLPKRVQILVAWQAGRISDKEAGDIANSVAFAFSSSEASTNDINVLKNDMQQAADKKINSEVIGTVGANASATIVNETRNTFLFSEEVEDQIASFTFVNDEPKTAICTALAGSTFEGGDADIIRYQPPLHHNCKSYIRANLKTSKNLPEVTGIPDLTQEQKDSITFKDRS